MKARLTTTSGDMANRFHWCCLCEHASETEPLYTADYTDGHHRVARVY